MGIPTPPSKPGYPSESDLGLGAKLAVADVMAILAGAVPLTPENYPAGALDALNFNVCPPGRRRIIVRGAAWSDTLGGFVGWELVKSDGTFALVDIQEGGTEVAPANLSGSANLRPITLAPGDFIRAVDINVMGGNIVGGIAYVDVEPR